MTPSHIQIERILFPTDFSPFSAQALRHALALARKFRARLKVVYVIPHVFQAGESVYAGVPWLMAPEVRQQAEAEMRGFLAPAREARIDHEIDVREGDPWREIVDAAEEMPADLVVMGTHGRGGLEHLFLGSVAEKLVRRLPCPVLTVCQEEGRTWETPGLLSRIPCATDFSETSSAALGFALALAEKNQAEVTLLHAIEGIVDRGEPSHFGLPDLQPLREDLDRQAQERLQKAISDAGGNTERTKARVAFGRAYKEILRVAAEERADLIVIGAQGHGLIEHMLSGSNAQHVIRRATCPVLTVRPPRMKAKSRDTSSAGLALALAR